jgi:DNA uptake protein ComE-like DNA-binding protein
LLGPGAGLDARLRARFEPLFGRDLGALRIHRDSLAASRLGAQAIALGPDLAFAPGRFSPDRPDGLRLLAHELAHSVQLDGGTSGGSPAGRSELESEADRAADSALAGASVLNLRAAASSQALAKPGDPIVVPWANGVTEEGVEGDNSRTLKLDGKDWLKLTTRGNKIDIKVTWFHAKKTETSDKGTKETIRDGVIVEVKSDSWVEGVLDVAQEQALLDANKGPREYAIDYQLAIHGRIRRASKGVEGPEVHEGPVRRMVLRSPDYPAVEIPFPSFPQEGWFRLDVPDSLKTFKNEKELKAFLDQNKSGKFAVIKMPDGGYAVRELSDSALQGIADKARSGDFDKNDWVSRFDWYKNRFGDGKLDRFVIGGRELQSLSELRDLYYSDDTFALAGQEGGQAEAEVFRMAKASPSYGRKPLSHEEALARWAALDRMTMSDVIALETEPGRPFSSLLVRGATRSHVIDLSYFLARQKYRDKLALIDKLTGDAKRAEESSLDAEIGENYLKHVLDKPVDEPGLVYSLKQHPGFAEEVARILYNRVEAAGQAFATNAFTGARDILRNQLGNDDKAPPFVFAFPRLSAEKQEQVLQLLNLDDGDRKTWKATLGNAKNAADIATGKEVGGISLTAFKSKALEAAKGMDKMVAKLSSRDLIAIRVKGEFGDWVRAAAYKELDIKLDPKAYPHDDKVPGAAGGAFDFDPFAGDRSSFTSLGEQMFAAEIRRRAAVDTIEKWAIIVGVLVVTLILVIALNAAGAAIAGWAATEGTLAYFAVNALVVGLGMTALELAQKKIEGGDVTWGDFFKSAAWNVATAGLLGRLGWGLRGATTVARIGWMGAAFMAAGVTRFLVEKKGKVTAAELGKFMVENAIMFALMEGVGVMTRSLNESAAAWGRAMRLGSLQPRMAALRGNVTSLVSDLSAYAAKPGEAAKDAASLSSREEAILKEQKAILEELQKSIRTEKDAANLEAQIKTELELIANQLEGMRQANFLADVKIAPIDGSQSNFTYDYAGSAADAAKKMEAFFPGSKAEIDPDGTIRLNLKGDPDPIVLTPKAIAKGPAVAIPDPATQKVNVNSASRDALKLLTGISDVLADAIIAERSNGDFASLEDLAKRVPGIATQKLAALKAQGLATVAPQPPPRPVVQWRADLNARRQRLLDRAAALKVKAPALDALRDLNRINSMTTEKSLRAAQTTVESAESVVGAKIEAKALASYGVASKALGAAETKRLRGGMLEGVSDKELGEALAAIRDDKMLATLTTEEMLGVIHAYRRGLDIARIFSAAKGQTPEARRFALESFSKIAEAEVPNIEKVLFDMASQPTKWDGGMFMLEFCLKRGARNVLSVEVPAEGGGRDYDVVLKTGEKYELKYWGAWEGGKVDHLRKQFLYDFGYGEVIDPHAWKTHRYVFRSPTPEALQNIRASFRGWLEQAMIAKGVNPDTRAKTLATFDAEAAAMITELAGFWSGTPAGKIDPPFIPMPAKGDDKDAPKVPPGANP